MSPGGASKSRRHSGRVTLGPCEALDGERICEPLNRVWVLSRESKVIRSYTACTCGRRFPLSSRALPGWLSHDVLTGSVPTPALEEPELASVVAGCWPEFEETKFSKIGVVPVGIEVLHRPGSFVDRDADSVRLLSARMLRTMEAARGIGLAANQVGAGVRLLAHNLPRIAPAVLVNPRLLAHSGEWDYEEGCLSLNVEGVRAIVRRPKEVTVVADLLDGTRLVLEADELLARVIQHEIDHLDGVEYVQRLTGSACTRVYGRMESAGVDTSWLPLRPYE